MNPQAVTVGARLGRRLSPVLVLAARKASDPVAFFGGLLASVVGQAAGLIGAPSAAELLRITLARLDQSPGAGRLELPPGVRLQLEEAETAAVQDDAVGVVLDGEAILVDQAANEERRAFGMTKARLLALVQALPDDVRIRVAAGTGEQELEILSIYAGEAGEAWIDVGRAEATT